MSNGVLLDLPTQYDLDKFTVWLAWKWRPLWYWYASKHDAIDIAKIAIAKAHCNWQPEGGANKSTWAVSTARLEYLQRQQHEHQWRRVNCQSIDEDDTRRTIDPRSDIARRLDTKAIVAHLKKNLKPRYWAILAARNELTLEEVSGMYDITRERVRQIERKAKEEARLIIRRLMTKNNCSDIHELY